MDYAEEEGQVIFHFSHDNEPVIIGILDAKEFIMNTLSSVILEKEIIGSKIAIKVNINHNHCPRLSFLNLPFLFHTERIPD